MAHAFACSFRISTLTLCLAALCPASAFPQASSDISSAATPTAAHVAYVYVGTTKGVYLYDAASNGSLSLVSGSPFSIAGAAIGSNGKYFFSLGTAYLHSYPIASNGAIKGQVAQINTTLYPGAEHGFTYGGTIDRTGTEAYVLWQGDEFKNDPASGLQSFHLNATTGALAFGGAAEFAGTSGLSIRSPLVIAGNNGHAYSMTEDYCDNEFVRFYRDRFGAMNVDDSSTITFPLPPAGGVYFPLAMASDNQNVRTGHMAVALHVDYDACGSSSPPALASYTVDYYGNLFYNGAMLKTAINPASMEINPQGNLLAVSAATSDPFYTKDGPGLQVFHFNGANPITSYSGVLTTAPIDEIHWGNNNHLYALSNSTKKLYAYTVTSSSITAVPGSPYTIASSPNALVVVSTSTACSAPSSNGVHICAPTSGSTVSSPVLVEAASTVTGTIARMELWVDGVKKYTATSSKQLNTTVSLAGGTHRFAVLAINTAGQKWQSAINATVK